MVGFDFCGVTPGPKETCAGGGLAKGMPSGREIQVYRGKWTAVRPGMEPAAGAICAESRCLRRKKQVPGELLLGNGIGPDRELSEEIFSEGGGQRDIGCIASARHRDPADARTVMTGIEGVPAIVEKDFEPGGKIHW